MQSIKFNRYRIISYIVILITGFWVTAITDIPFWHYALLGLAIIIYGILVGEAEKHD